MVQILKSYDGALVFWTLSEQSNRDRLKAGLDALGFGEHVPEPRANVTVLKDALIEVFGNRNYIIRPLSARQGFTVKTEAKGNDDNEYETYLTAKVANEHDAPIFTGDQSRIHEITNLYFKMKGQLSSAQLGISLVAIMKAIAGIRLRPTGGIYWIEGKNVETWEKVVTIAEGASDGGVTKGYVIKHSFDPQSISAVKDALVYEVTTEARKISEEILSGEVGNRAIKARKEEALALRAKVVEYENILGVALDSLKKNLDDIEQTNAVASILIAAGVGSENLSLKEQEVSNGTAA
jgi:hypothetical protein